MNKLKSGEYTLNKYENQYKQSAKRRQKFWNLTREQFRNLVILQCHYCHFSGRTLNAFKKRNGEYNSSFISSGVSSHYADNENISINGIDRKDNDKGYEINNCVSCCSKCNEAKGNRYSYKEWHAMTKYFRKKNV